MPPVPRRDYSVPQPAGFQLGTDGKRVPFPTVKRAALAIHNLARRFFPNPNDFSTRGGSPTPREMQRRPLPPSGERVPYVNPRWPKLPPGRGNPKVLSEPGPLKEQ